MGKDILENILEEIVGKKGKILLGLWRYKERISESGGGNRWRKTKRRNKRKREREGEEREREREGKEGRPVVLPLISGVLTVGVHWAES